MEELLRSVGKRIQDLRKQRGWSQEKFAEICGVHRTFVGHLEQATKRGVTLMSIARAADALGVTLAQLFSGVGPVPEAVPEKPARKKPLSPAEMPLRVGRNAIRIEKLIEEMRLERDMMRQVLRRLNHIAPNATGDSSDSKPGPKKKGSRTPKNTSKSA